MFINPKTAIAEGWLTLPSRMSPAEQEKCIQPNAVDFTVDRLFELNSTSRFTISESAKQMRKQQEIFADQSGFWSLYGGNCYDVMSDFYVNVPDGVACYLVTRSTFVRNGLFLQSGLFDSGFNGNVGCVLFNIGGIASIAPHTRIGQIIFVESQTSGKMYAGGYNVAAGTHWANTTTITQ